MRATKLKTLLLSILLLSVFFSCKKKENDSDSQNSNNGNPNSNGKGTITFWSKHGFAGDPLIFTFNGVNDGEWAPVTYQSDPGCVASGCRIYTDVPYGTYSYVGVWFNHDGTIRETYSGSVTLNSSCTTQVIN